MWRGPMALFHSYARKRCMFMPSAHVCYSLSACGPKPCVDDPPKYTIEQLRSMRRRDFDANDIVGLEGLLQTNKILPMLTLKQYKIVIKMHTRRLELPPHLKPKDLTAIPKRGPVKHLTKALRKSGGRNETGRITVRHRGGGFKRRLRLIDIRRDQAQEAQRVVRMEHDPNRSAKIALLQGVGSKRLSYIVSPIGLKPNDVLQNDGSPSVGHHLPLSSIPVGSFIYNIEVRPGSGAKLVRSAGTKAKYVGTDSTARYAIIELPSKKTKNVLLTCKATMGQVNNPEWHHRTIGKAGRNRNLGIRPTVRGVAMNPVDHPHGGGKGGKSKGHHSQSPWGKICK